MIDRGLSVAEVDGLLEVAGDSVDIVKLGWGTALVSANLRPKLERYAAHGIPVVLGGTLTEIAIRQGRVDGLVAWLRELGPAPRRDLRRHDRRSTPAVKRELIERLSKEFTVFAEVGSKDVDFIMAAVHLGRADRTRSRRRRVEGDRRGARVGHGGHLPRRRRAAHGADRRDRALDRHRAA